MKWKVLNSDEAGMWDIDTGKCILRMVTDDYQMVGDICTEHNESAPSSPEVTAEQLRDNYTFSQECCVDGVPDARTVWIKIGNQSFSIDGYQDTKEEADWMRLMLGKAFQSLVARALSGQQEANEKLKAILPFAKAMLLELQANAHKGDWSQWEPAKHLGWKCDNETQWVE